MSNPKITFPSLSVILTTVEELNEIVDAEDGYELTWTGQLYTPDAGGTWWFQVTDNTPEAMTSWVINGYADRGSLDTFAEIQNVRLADVLN